MDNDERTPFVPDNGVPILINEDQLIVMDFQVDKSLGFKRLFNRYYENLCSHAMRFVFSDNVSEDIVSDVFYLFWKNDLHLSVLAYKPYLYQAVRFRCFNYLKRELNSTESLTDVTNVDLQVGSPDDIMFYTEMYNHLNELIEKLPPQSRKAYILKQLEGKKNKEIAQEMGISVKAVEALLSRSVVKIREALKEFLT
jgi:RNA polymerase sigma-70 factor (family 1)